MTNHDRARTLRDRVVRGAVLLWAPIVLSLAGCAAHVPPSAPGRPPRGVLQTTVGLASYYGEAFNGRLTASGARYDMNAMVAAHPTYPLGTLVRVTNLANGRSVRVQIVDRGPAPGPRSEGVIIDLSRGAARELRLIQAGRARVRVDVLRWGTSP